MEKPIDVPVFLEIVRDLLLETAEQRRERICGSAEYCRYVARNYETSMSLLQERRSWSDEVLLGVESHRR